jgi:hypothetical protein
VWANEKILKILTKLIFLIYEGNLLIVFFFHILQEKLSPGRPAPRRRIIMTTPKSSRNQEPEDEDALMRQHLV